jgi:hypothetical protein
MPLSTEHRQLDAVAVPRRWPRAVRLRDALLAPCPLEFPLGATHLGRA